MCLQPLNLAFFYLNWHRVLIISLGLCLAPKWLFCHFPFQEFQILVHKVKGKILSLSSKNYHEISNLYIIRFKLIKPIIADIPKGDTSFLSNIFDHYSPVRIFWGHQIMLLAVLFFSSAPLFTSFPSSGFPPFHDPPPPKFFFLAVV